MSKALVPLAAALLLSGTSAHAVDAIQLRAQPDPAPAAAPAPAPAPAADPLAGVPRIAVADAKKAVEDGKAVLLDVNPIGAYDAGHAKGAIGIPAHELYARTGELPKGKQIIAYCSCHAEQTSARVVIDLKRQGFEAAALLGGLQAWKDAGYEVEPKPAS